MKPKYLLLVAAAALALLVLRLFLVGPEERIRRMLQDLTVEASKAGPEKPLVAAATARSLSQAFAPEAVGEDLRDGGSVHGRDGIARAIGWARESWDAAELRWEELEIVLEGEEAARASGRLRVRAPDGAPVGEDGTRVRLEIVKTGGDWLIARAEVERPRQ